MSVTSVDEFQRRQLVKKLLPELAALENDNARLLLKLWEFFDKYPEHFTAEQEAELEAATRRLVG